MKKVKRSIIILISALIVCTVLGIAVLAYYEYYGQYRGLITVDGRIEVYAFGVLYEDMRQEPTYGVSPENPYVIENYRHLNNLIRLNNGGKLETTKAAADVEKYYFVLNFEDQPTPQVLDLSAYTTAPIGNEAHPFVDELSGMVYAYAVPETNVYLYYSSCLPVLTIENDQLGAGGSYTYGDDSFENVTAGKYLYVPRNYTIDAQGNIIYSEEAAIVPMNSLIPVRQMIANATVTAEDTELDVGFFGHIGYYGDENTDYIIDSDGNYVLQIDTRNDVGSRGYVHDLILYNTQITCIEEQPGTLRTLINDILDAIIGGGENHYFSDTPSGNSVDGYSVEDRHIGIFAGHIDGAAKNISVAGDCGIEIKSESVDYFSRFTSVGLCSRYAIIGGMQFIEDGNVALPVTQETGVMFADNIYSAAESQFISYLENSHSYTHEQAVAITDLLANDLYINNANGTFYTDIDLTHAIITTAIDGSVASFHWADGGSLLMSLENNIFKDAAGNDMLLHETTEQGESVYTSYEAAPSRSVILTEKDGVSHFRVVSIDSQGEWIETESGAKLGGGGLSHSFSKGSVKYVLSDGNDTVSSIWSGKGVLHMLGNSGYLSRSSVLYCTDEYRYSEEVKPGGNISQIASSVSETRYNGVAKLVSSVSIVDKGKYIIAAKVPDGNDGFDYYALKIHAESVSGSDVLYNFDTTDACIITDYINDPTGNISVFSSCMWNVNEDSITPTFKNNRFSTEYLSGTENAAHSSFTIKLDKNDPCEFSCDIVNNTFFKETVYQSGNEVLTVRYYLNFHVVGNAYEFYFSQTPETNIQIYQISSGYSVEPVTSAAEFTVNDDYVIAAYNTSNNSYMMLGVGVTQNEDGTITVTGTFTGDVAMPTENGAVKRNWSVAQYQEYKNRVWYASAASGNALSLRDKSSATYYLTASNATLSLGAAETFWSFVHQVMGTGEGTLSQSGSYVMYDATLAGTTQFTAATAATTICLYKIAPEDDDPLYITYQGAELQTAESSSIGAGQYVIAVNTSGDNYVGLAVNNSGNIVASDMTSLFANSASLNNDTAINNIYYKWAVDTTSFTPAFRSLYGTSRYLSGGSVPTLAGTSTEWMYDAIGKRIYYKNGETVYYLRYSAAGFSISTLTSESGYNYSVGLYLVKRKYSYTITAAENNNVNFTYNTNANNNANRLALYTNQQYIIATRPLTNLGNSTALAPYVIGTHATGDGLVEIENLTEYSSTLNGNTFTTNFDLSYYKWNYSYASGTTNNAYSSQLQNAKTDVYLCASSSFKARSLGVCTESNAYRGTSLADNSPITGFIYYEDQNTPGNFYLCFKGDNSTTYGALYYSYMDEYGAIATNRHDERYPTPGTTYNADVKPIYLYAVSGESITVSLDLLDEEGDLLQSGMHYMITSKLTHGTPTADDDEYYAARVSVDEDNIRFVDGTNVTSTVNAIMESTAGGVAYSTDALTMVAVEADWYQTSNARNLRFSHTLTSTDSLRVYLQNGADVGVTDISTDLPITDSHNVDWYYDAISKYMKCIVSGTDLYLTYADVNSDGKYEFALTNDINSATNIYLFRFKPTYRVTNVSEIGEDLLKTGDFIIAGYSSEGFTAIGSSNTSDPTTADVSPYVSLAEQTVLNEAGYNQIKQCIWSQKYYEYHPDVNYGTSPVSMAIFDHKYGYGLSVATTGAQGTGRALSIQGTSMRWEVTPYENGRWMFNNGDQLGSIVSGNVGIQFTGPQSSMTFSDTYPSVGKYFGASSVTAVFSESGTAFKLYSANGTAVTAASENGQYALVAEIGGIHYVATYSGGSVVLTAETLLTGLDPSQLWTASKSAGDTFLLSNGTAYASANTAGEITTAASTTGRWRAASDSTVSFISTYSIPYATGQTGTLYTNNAQYTARIYSTLSRNGNSYTFSDPIDNITNGDQVWVVVNSGTAYYCIAYYEAIRTGWFASSDYSLQSLALNVESLSETEMIASCDTQLDQRTNGSTGGWFSATTAIIPYWSIVNVTGSNFSLSQAGNATRYLYYSGTSISSGTSASTWYHEGEYLFSNANRTTYTPRATVRMVVPSTQSEAAGTVYFYDYNSTGPSFSLVYSLEAGKSYVMIQAIGGEYYLISHNATSFSRVSLGTSIPNLSTFFTSGRASLADSLITSTAGNDGVTLSMDGYFINDGGDEILLQSSQSSVWNYSYIPPDGGALLNTVVQTAINSTGIGVSRNRFVAQGDSTVFVYTVAGSEGNYTLTRKTTSGMPTGNVLLAVYADSKYYVLTLTDGVLTSTEFAAAPTNANVTSGMVWNCSGSQLSKDDGYYKLRCDNNEFYVSQGDLAATANFTYTTANTGFSAAMGTAARTPLYIFNVAERDELDMFTDTETMLSSKLHIVASMSILQSSNYVIVGQSDTDSDNSIDKYYSLSFADLNTSVTLDLTDIMKEAIAEESGITLFDSCVWEMKGETNQMLFVNSGYQTEYYLTGVEGNRGALEPRIETPGNDLSPYRWKTYTFVESDGNTYLLGFSIPTQDSETDYYMFFDMNSLTFRITTDVNIAKNATSMVQLYQLGTKASTAEQPSFETVVIETAEDGLTIISYPLTEVTADDQFNQYSQTGESILGQYVMLAKENSSYYALTTDMSGTNSFVDVALYFHGSYIRNDDGMYCLSVNDDYIWNQMSETPSQGMTFQNEKKRTYLCGNDAVFSYDAATHRFSYTLNSTTYYIAFSVADGYSVTTNAALAGEIYIYALGVRGTTPDTGDGILGYTYYSSAISTSPNSSVPPENFPFEKMLIEGLPNYAVGRDGLLGSTTGWYRTDGGGDIITEVNDSLYFKKGLVLTSVPDGDAQTLCNDMTQYNYENVITDEESGTQHSVNFNYYVPSGVAGIVVTGASNQFPVFMNVIATTEIDDSSCDADYIRYLSLWKIASVDITSNTTTPMTPSGEDFAMNYANSFYAKIDKPDFAIPLPNCKGTTESGATAAHVAENDTLVPYYLNEGNNGVAYPEALIAHTFVITEPGVYYLGASYGSVAISYLSLDNRALLEDGETTGIVKSLIPTIDFVYGEPDVSVTAPTTFESMNDSVGDVIYVPRDEEGTDNDWFNSYIIPLFVRARSELTYFDRLKLTVRRTAETESDGEDGSIAVSYVNVDALTKPELVNLIQYENDNSSYQRRRQKVRFNVLAEFASIGDVVAENATWNAIPDEESFTFTSDGGRLLSVYTDGVASSNWICDNSGKVKTADGTLYLVFDAENGRMALSADAANAFTVYSEQKSAVTSLVTDTSYIIAFASANSCCVPLPLNS